jgi:hypothetical protein
VLRWRQASVNGQERPQLGCQPVRNFLRHVVAGRQRGVRLSPVPGKEESLRVHLQQLLSALPQRPGVTAAHVLRTQTPQAATTTEQRIRGGADGVADWIVLVAGYDVDALQGLAEAELGASALGAAGALPAQVSTVYRLSFAMTPQDL